MEKSNLNPDLELNPSLKINEIDGKKAMEKYQLLVEMYPDFSQALEKLFSDSITFEEAMDILHEFNRKYYNPSKITNDGHIYKVSGFKPKSPTSEIKLITVKNFDKVSVAEMSITRK